MMNRHWGKLALSLALFSSTLSFSPTSFAHDAPANNPSAAPTSPKPTLQTDVATPTVAPAPTAPSPSVTPPAAAPAPTAPPAVQAQSPSAAANTPFDGKLLYKAAFEEIRERHIKLDTPEKLAAFSKEWEHKYDNSGELNSEEGTDKAILSMMQSLGQRFDYSFDRAATKAEEEQVNATLSGIGATLRLSQAEQIRKSLPKDSKLEERKKAFAISSENRLQIDEPMEGSPAEKAGLKHGDSVIKVDGKEINGMQLPEVQKLIKGEAGSTVTLSIERSNEGKVEKLEINITRGLVSVPVVKFRELGDGVSYVKLRDFMSKNAMREMRDALVKAAKGKALVLDLRDNPGGSLPAVLTMLGMMLEDGPVLVTRSRVGEHIIESEVSLNKNYTLRMEPEEDDPSKIETSVGPRPALIIPNDMPIVVLINEGSASASEILSGCLQHNRRASVVGMPSVGKGVGQSVVKLPFGRSLHVTSFEFVPGRTANDWIGVIPNQKVENDSDKPQEDKQLDSARQSALTQVKALEEMKKERESQLKKNQDEFQKQLQERGKH